MGRFLSTGGCFRQNQQAFCRKLHKQIFRFIFILHAFCGIDNIIAFCHITSSRFS